MDDTPLTRQDLLEAWERVRENDGCAGADGVSLERFVKRLDEHVDRLLERVLARTYRPIPLLKIVVEKRPGSAKMRRLLVPAVADRVLHTAVSRRLSRSFEEEFLECSFAYRPGRGVDRAIARVTQWRDRGFLYVVDADIVSFFDLVEHRLLEDLVTQRQPTQEILYLLRQWIHASFWDGSKVIRLRRGIAQGSPLSPLLANFYLGGLDSAIEQSGNHLVRYADDFLILCRTEEDARLALAATAAALEPLQLKLHPEKTRITAFHSGFQFLGVYFVGEETWIPWKGKRPRGKVLFVAQPMPARLLEKYRSPPPRSAMEQAFLRAGRLRPARRVETEQEGDPDVAHLYISEQGAILRKSGDRFLVEREDQILADLPYHKLEQVALFGNIQVTTQAMAELLEKGIRLSFFSRGGRYRGALSQDSGRSVTDRLRQFEMYKDPATSVDFARRLLSAKIANGLEVLRRAAARAGGTEEFHQAADVLRHGLVSLEKAEAVSAFLGIEGGCARAYFQALMSYNRSGFPWPGRKHHPAPDPLNSLLSLAYTLLVQELRGLIEGLGLDPYFGFLHELESRRPSLALDLMEPLRHPVADRFVLTIVNRGEFQPSDFQPRDGGQGLLLTTDALKRFLSAYERWMLASPIFAGNHLPPFRQVLKNEAEEFLAGLRKPESWKPFHYEQYNGGEEECSTSSRTI